MILFVYFTVVYTKFITGTQDYKTILCLHLILDQLAYIITL